MDATCNGRHHQTLRCALHGWCTCLPCCVGCRKRDQVRRAPPPGDFAYSCARCRNTFWFVGYRPPLDDPRCPLHGAAIATDAARTGVSDGTA